MKFRVVDLQTSQNSRSPVRVIEQSTGREVGWVNHYLDREYVRRLAPTSLRLYAHNLLHFVRWWASTHRTDDVLQGDLTESTLLDYLRFQSGLDPRPSGSTINDRVAVADRALRNEFPEAPCQIARGFHQAYLRRRPMGLASVATKCNSLAGRRISPHSFRHSTAMHLLQSGVDLTVIQRWLGHVQLATTHAYVEIDLEMKKKALSACTPPVDADNGLRKILDENRDVISWLERL